VLWCCWLGGRKGIRPVKNWVVRCWHGYLSAARCRLAYGPADATATHCLLLQQNPDWILDNISSTFWYRPTRVVPEKGPLNGVCVILHYIAVFSCSVHACIETVISPIYFFHLVHRYYLYLTNQPWLYQQVATSFCDYEFALLTWYSSDYVYCLLK